jgi:hypothetical protein
LKIEKVVKQHGFPTLKGYRVIISFCHYFLILEIQRHPEIGKNTRE